jgi:hypothetical protein
MALVSSIAVPTNNTDVAGSNQISEMTIELVRNRLLYPTCPDLQVLPAEQARRHFEVS